MICTHLEYKVSVAIDVSKNRNSSSASKCPLINSAPCDSKFKGLQMLRGTRLRETRLREQTSINGLRSWNKKQDNPALKDVEQDTKVKEAIGKIKGMQDPKEAVKNL